jgi:hypothetical protein
VGGHAPIVPHPGATGTGMTGKATGTPTPDAHR